MSQFVQLLIGGLKLGCTYGMLALGYSLIYQASGYMNFTQANLMMFGAFIAYQLYVLMNAPFIVALVVALVVMFAIGWMMERFVIRRLVNKHAKNVYVVLATIALSIIIENAAMLIWGANNKNFKPIFDGQPIKIGSTSVQKEEVLCIVVALVAMVLLHLFLNKTKFGTSMRASAQSKMAASCMGINVNMTIGVTYGIAALLACMAGVMIAPTISVSTQLGNTYSAKSFAGAVIGGYGNIYGAIVGSLLIGLLESFVGGYITSQFKEFIVYGVMILFMIFKPTGLFNAKVYST